MSNRSLWIVAAEESFMGNLGLVSQSRRGQHEAWWPSVFFSPAQHHYPSGNHIKIFLITLLPKGWWKLPGPRIEPVFPCIVINSQGMLMTQVWSLIREDSKWYGSTKPVQPQLLSLRAATVEAVCCNLLKPTGSRACEPQLLKPRYLKPVLCNKRRHLWSATRSPYSAIRSPYTATKGSPCSRN